MRRVLACTVCLLACWAPDTALAGGPPTVAVLAYSSDGSMLATASTDWTIRIWDSRTHTELGSPLRDGGPVASAAFSPDGTRLVSASLAGVRIWDLASGNEIGAPLSVGLGSG